MKIKEGENIPSVDFFHINESGVPEKIQSTKLLENHKAIVIGVPGAFTKVCSAKHLPGYVNNYEEAKKKGITKIICVSVNDANVMKAWGDNQNVGDKVFMAADPYCSFTKSIGAEIDRTEKGLGMRSARYTMLIENNVIKSIKVEEDTATCEISAAENFIKEI
jgi:peroxiredoxin